MTLSLPPLGYKRPLTEALEIQCHPHHLVLEPSLCYSLAVLTLHLFIFAESDEQRVSTMVSLAKVSVAFMWVMSDMYEMECNGQLKIQNTLLETAFNQMFPQGLPMFTQQSLHDFPLM